MFILYLPKTSHYFKKICLSLSLLGFFSTPLQATPNEPTTNSKTSQAIDLLEYKYAMLQIQKESTQSAADRAPYLITAGGICLIYWIHSTFNIDFEYMPTPSQIGLSFITLMTGVMLTAHGFAAWAINSKAEQELPLIQKQIAILKKQQSDKSR